MDEDIFNMELRKFLKKVAVTSQREIEQAVRAAFEQGAIGPDSRLTARVRLTIEEVGLETEIDGTIALR